MEDGTEQKKMLNSDKLLLFVEYWMDEALEVPLDGCYVIEGFSLALRLIGRGCVRYSYFVTQVAPNFSWHDRSPRHPDMVPKREWEKSHSTPSFQTKRPAGQPNGSGCFE